MAVVTLSPTLSPTPPMPVVQGGKVLGNSRSPGIRHLGIDVVCEEDGNQGRSAKDQVR